MKVAIVHNKEAKTSLRFLYSVSFVVPRFFVHQECVHFLGAVSYYDKVPDFFVLESNLAVSLLFLPAGLLFHRFLLGTAFLSLLLFLIAYDLKSIIFG